METTLLKIELIRMDGGTQPRAAIDFSAVDDYMEAMACGATFPPVVVFYDGTHYWLADGFHRVKAAVKAGLTEIACELHQGTKEAAQWYSFGANKTNGLRRTNDDKQRAVKAALLHPKSHRLSNSAIARHVGVDHQTVHNWRAKLEASCEIRKIETRTATRKGKTYQQNTSNIGRKRKRSRSSAAPSAPAAPTEGGQPEDAPPPSARTIRAQRIDRLARMRVSLLEQTKQFAHLVAWLGETHGDFDQAEALLAKAQESTAALSAEIERIAVAADPLNASRLGIQEKQS